MPTFARLAAAVVVLLASAAPAAADPPRYARPARTTPVDPALVAAEEAWAAAVREPDPRLAADRWRTAARAFDTVAASTTAAAAVRAEAAYAALLSWKNALATDPTVRTPPIDDDPIDAPPAPRPLDPDAAAFVASLGRYLALAPPTDDELPGIRFLRATTLRRANHFDEAAIDLVFLLEHHRSHEVGAYAANLLLDGFIVTERYDELLRWVRILRADAGFLRAQPDLAERLLEIEQRSLRLAAERLEQDAKTHRDRDAYDRCGAAYDQTRALAPTSPDADELLYNAGVCYAEGGSADLALARYRQILRDHPRSVTAARALARHAHLSLQLGRIADAADGFSRYARLYAGERDAYEALSDAIHLHLGAGDRDAAALDADYFLKTFSAKRRRDAVAGIAVVARARLAHGERVPAARALTAALRSLPSDRDPDGDTALGALAWDAACPVAPTDGLCLRRGRPARTPALAGLARALLERAHTPHAALLLADAKLEALLALPTPPPRRRTTAWRTQLDAAAAAARTAYDAILADAQPDAVDPDTVILAHARLGHLTLHLHRLDGSSASASPSVYLIVARQAFTACADRALHDQRPSLLATCEAGLARAGVVTPPIRERLAAPAPTRPRPAPEPPTTAQPQPL